MPLGVLKQIYPLLYNGDAQGNYKDFTESVHYISETLGNNLRSYLSLLFFFFFNSKMVFFTYSSYPLLNSQQVPGLKVYYKKAHVYS